VEDRAELDWNAQPVDVDSRGLYVRGIVAPGQPRRSLCDANSNCRAQPGKIPPDIDAYHATERGSVRGQLDSETGPLPFSRRRGPGIPHDLPHFRQHRIVAAPEIQSADLPPGNDEGARTGCGTPTPPTRSTAERRFIWCRPHWAIGRWPPPAGIFTPDRASLARGKSRFSYCCRELAGGQDTSMAGRVEEAP
jgi:hypothetical protein